MLQAGIILHNIPRKSAVYILNENVYNNVYGDL